MGNLLKRGRGRPKGSKKVDPFAPKSHLKVMNLICTKCKQTVQVTTGNIELYTDEVKKNYVCAICK